MLKYIFALLDWSKALVFLYGKNKRVLFKEGEIWWCSVGMNVGAEIYGKGPKFERPVLIMKKFHDGLFFGIPITSKIKKGDWYAPVHFDGAEVTAVLNQARTLDSKRLTERMGTLTEDNFQGIKQKLFTFYGSLNIRPSPEGEGTVGNPNDD
jgi:mRNA interferase MazF